MLARTPAIKPFSLPFSPATNAQMAEECHHLQDQVKELHKQRYKALVTNASLAIKVDKLQNELDLEMKKVADTEAKLVALEAERAEAESARAESAKENVIFVLVM